MSNKYKRWTEIDNMDLLSFIKLNLSIDEISAKLERSKYGVIKQLEKILINNNLLKENSYEEMLFNIAKNTDNIMTKSESVVIQEEQLKNEIRFVLDDIITEIEDTNDLNDEQKKCYKYAKKRDNLFITGSSGVGKSTVLKKIIKYFKKNKFNIGVTASTGSAATLINGTTVHSFLGIGLGTQSATQLYESLMHKKNKTVYNKLKKLDVLIIDEISMIDDQLFSKIAGYLSLIKQIKKPFGKIQIILCGDFYQLAPVNNDYCFKSNIWNKLKIKTIELKLMMRQQDDIDFQKLLIDVKLSRNIDYVYDILKTRKIKPTSEIKPTKLYSTNKDIDKINSDEFIKLVEKTKNRIYKYNIMYEETNSKTQKYISNSNICFNLELCIGLQVMLTYNIDITKNLVNGTRGVIKNLFKDRVILMTIDGEEHTIEYVDYIHDLDECIKFSYMPIRIAYAISIHKSQGLTLDCIEIDLGNSIFGEGMSYVALSRARTLDSVYITKLSKHSFKTNEDVKAFYN